MTTAREIIPGETIVELKTKLHGNQYMTLPKGTLGTIIRVLSPTSYLVQLKHFQTIADDDEIIWVQEKEVNFPGGEQLRLDIE